MTKTTAESTSAQSYTPYGTNLSSAGDSEAPYGFTGEYTDGTGNIYLRARYYNPNDGRFLTKDTFGGQVNQPLSLNRWMYVEGNPVNLTDPSGNSPDIATQILNQALSIYTPYSVNTPQFIFNNNCLTVEIPSNNSVYSNIADTSYSGLCFKVIWDETEWFPGGPTIIVLRLVPCDEEDKSDINSILG